LSDHQQYDVNLLQDIKRQADSHNSDIIITTCKDWVKTNDFDFGREFYYLDLVVDLDPGEEKLREYIIETLKLSDMNN
jgi:tetraacyldisaccharide-1-P 4'-kinase